MIEKSSEENRHCFTSDISRQPQDVSAADVLAHVSSAHLDEELKGFYAERAAVIDKEVACAVKDGELDSGVAPVIASDADANFAEDVGKWLANADGSFHLPPAEAAKIDNTVPHTLGNIATNGLGFW